MSTPPSDTASNANSESSIDSVHSWMSEFCGWDVMDTVLSAPDAHLRIALKALCVDDKVRHKMAMYLWRLSLMDDPEGPAHTGTTTLQQAADGDLQICIQCGKAFYESKNGESSCVHHYHSPQILGMDGDWRNRAYGVKPDMWFYQTEAPEKVEFPCCGRPGRSLGCSNGPHRAMDGIREQYLESPFWESDEGKAWRASRVNPKKRKAE